MIAQKVIDAKQSQIPGSSLITAANSPAATSWAFRSQHVVPRRMGISAYCIKTSDRDCQPGNGAANLSPGLCLVAPLANLFLS